MFSFGWYDLVTERLSAKQETWDIFIYYQKIYIYNKSFIGCNHNPNLVCVTIGENIPMYNIIKVNGNVWFNLHSGSLELLVID